VPGEQDRQHRQQHGAQEQPEEPPAKVDGRDESAQPVHIYQCHPPAPPGKCHSRRRHRQAGTGGDTHDDSGHFGLPRSGV
jgi:hypothetical protein